MSDIRKKIIYEIGEATGDEVVGKTAEYIAEKALSIVREAVSAVRQRVEKDYEQAKMAHQFRQYEFPEPKEPTVSDYHDALMEVLS